MAGASHIGKFTIDKCQIDRMPKVALAILNGCIVVQAENKWHSDQIEYMAISDQFDEVPVGDACPEYEPQIKDLVGGKYHVTWERKRTT